MTGRIRIEPYKPLDVRTPAIPGGGYINVDSSAGNFGPPSWLQFGPQGNDDATGITRLLSGLLERDDEAAVKDADSRLAETEQALLFDPTQGYLNSMGEAALNRAPDVIDAYGEAQRREIERLGSDTQRQILEDLAQRRLTTFSEQVERHGAAERLRWHDTTAVPPGPSILVTPRPEIELPTIYEYEKWQYHPDRRPFTDEEYDEFQKDKIPYMRNPAHPDGDTVVKKYRREDEVRKTPIPPDAEKVYLENSVKADKKTWIGRNEHGVYYKYQHDKTGRVHFQGYLTEAQIQQYFGKAARPTLRKLAQ